MARASRASAVGLLGFAAADDPLRVAMCASYAFLAASRAVSLTWRTLLATLLTF
jgi:hypothetical protein